MFTILVASIIAILLSGCVTEENIKIGVLLPLTGDLGPIGEGMKKGAELAVFEINQQGGINGRNVSLIVEDTGTDPSKAAEAARKLIDVDKVQVIVGAAASSCTLAAAQIAEKNKVVMVSPASTSPKITEAGDYIFRNVGSDLLQGQALADLAKAKGYKKAATLVLNNDYGIGMEDVFKKHFSEVVKSVKYEKGKGDYRTELEDIKSANPDVIMLVAYPESGSIILKQARELDVKIDWIAAEGIADTKMFDNPQVATAMEGMLLTRPSSPKNDPNYQKFLNSYKQKYGNDPGIYADYTYDAVNLVSKAIEEGGYNGESIKNALFKVSEHYKGATGDKTFDENGDMKSQFYEIIVAKNKTFESIGSWTLETGIELLQ
ncbi:MAG: ABC transporter substrate-binding protein [Methanosarcinales archaeon]